MIAVIDYGLGNLRSVQKGFEFVGLEAVVTRDYNVINSASRIVLPGVGAFKDAMARLKQYKLDMVINHNIEKNKPFLGICLGLQLLFTKSYEGGSINGLNILKGEIKRIDNGLKVPHMGWNTLEIKKDNQLFKGISNNSYVYFVHSYYLETPDDDIVIATTDYGRQIQVGINRDNIFATQFHPEKSSSLGLKMLKNFGELVI